MKPHDRIRYVTFHFYNEPTLDPFFEDRIAVLQRHGMRLRLFTNASHLDDRKIEALKRSGVLDVVVVNLPTLDEREFREFTQSKTHAKTVRNLESAIESGLPVGIAVNGVDDESAGRVADLRERYATRGVPVNVTVTADRAGSVAGRYNQAVHVEGPLRGCTWPVNHGHFSVKGDMFICCNDYYQREIFGNVRSGSIHEVMTSPEAMLLRRRVFGVAEAPSDYLCRSCHDQFVDFPLRQFRPLVTFPVHELRTVRAAPGRP